MLLGRYKLTWKLSYSLVCKLMRNLRQVYKVMILPLNTHQTLMCGQTNVCVYVFVCVCVCACVCLCVYVCVCVCVCCHSNNHNIHEVLSFMRIMLAMLKCDQPPLMCSGVARPGPTRACALPSTFQALPSVAQQTHVIP